MRTSFIKSDIEPSHEQEENYFNDSPYKNEIIEINILIINVFKRHVAARNSENETAYGRRVLFR